MSSRFGPVYDLSKYLLPIISPLCGNSETFVKNSTNFVSIVKMLKLTENDLMVSFDVVNLFPSVPVDKTLKIVRALLEADHTLSDRTAIPIDGVL